MIAVPQPQLSKSWNENEKVAQQMLLAEATCRKQAPVGSEVQLHCTAVNKQPAGQSSKMRECRKKKRAMSETLRSRVTQTQIHTQHNWILNLQGSARGSPAGHTPAEGRLSGQRIGCDLRGWRLRLSTCDTRDVSSNRRHFWHAFLIIKSN